MGVEKYAYQTLFKKASCLKSTAKSGESLSTINSFENFTKTKNNPRAHKRDPCPYKTHKKKVSAQNCFQMEQNSHAESGCKANRPVG